MASRPGAQTRPHREVTQLVALAIVAVAAFIVTRAVAISNRELSIRNAAEWYRRGERLEHEGRIDEAIASFRRATMRKRTDRTYVLALSRALAQKRDYDAARRMLMTVRESVPEDADINLELARLSAMRQDVTEASRFFHDALYAAWPLEQAEQRRAVRIELIRFLLAHGELNRAQSELLGANADLPDDVPHHLELAGLFHQAGDDRGALTHFQRALHLAPGHAGALAGAGRAAFDLGEYSIARRYLHESPTDNREAREIRQVVDLVLSRDPLAHRMAGRARRQRLAENLSYLDQRLADCGQSALRNQLQAFGRASRRATADEDTIDTGADLVDRAAREALASCEPLTPLDRALILIARQHAAVPQ